VNDLEKKRRAILKEAKRVKKMGEKLDGNIAKAQDTLKHARNMEEKYVTLIQNQINEGSDPQLARNLEFTVPTAETLARMYIKNPPYVDKNCDEVRATPVVNIVAAKELLEHNQSPTALETALKLMTKALVKQEKTTSSRRLESDPALCRSSTASKARGNENYGTHPDNESHIGSSEARRREARNKADAIPISSDDKPHGKGQQRNPSPPHKNYPAYGYHQDKAQPRHKTNMPPPKYKTFEIPKGEIVIRDNDVKRGRSRDAGQRDEPPRRETSQDGGSKHREPSRHDDSVHRSGYKDKHRSSCHRDDKGQGSRRHDDDPAPRRAEGSHRSCKDPSQDVESKRRDPSPSPPSSPHGSSGGSPARSHASRKDLQDKKPYDTCTHLNEIAKSQTAFFLGPKCFGQRIRDEPIPHGFKIEKNIRQYNRVDMPLTWLQDYFNAVQFAAGSPKVAVRYLPLMLFCTVRQWINDLAENSIQTWFDMQTAFTENFEGTYKRPHNIGDLQRCQRADDETSQTFLARWLDMKNSCEGVTDESAILAFIDSLERGQLLRHRLLRERNKGKLTLNSMITIASNYAAGDDDARESVKASAIQNTRKRNNSNKRKNLPEEQQTSDMVATTFSDKGQSSQCGRGRGSSSSQP
jgi:hypothetical protein